MNAAASLIGRPYSPVTNNSETSKRNAGFGHSELGPGPTLTDTGGNDAISVSDGYIDCSGLVRYAYAAAGIDLGSGGTVDQITFFNYFSSTTAPKPGDVAFWKHTSAAVSHVAIYVGNGQRIDASSGRDVKQSDMYSDGFLGYYTLKPQYGSLDGPGGTGTYAFVLPVGDFDGDQTPDILMVERDGKLMMQSGDGHGGFDNDTMREVGTGTNSWQNFQHVVGAGDLDNDGIGDVLAVTTTGKLRLYTGSGTGTFDIAGGTEIGSSGWSAYTKLFGVGDFNEDGDNDWLAVDSIGDLYLYKGDGTGGYAPRERIGWGWGVYSSAFGVGLFDSDNFPDILAVDQLGDLYLYTGDGDSGYAPRTKIGWSWQGYSQAFGAGDVDGDGRPDVMAIDSSGQMWRYSGDGLGDFLPGTGQVVGTSGWNAFPIVQTVGDWTNDTHPDVLAMNSSGDIFLYKGNGVDNFQNPTGSPRIGWGWGNFKSVFGVDNFSNDTIDDALAIHNNGSLYLYKGNGTGGYLPGEVIGSSWAGFKQALGVGDLSGDGKPDVLAIESAGTLRLYRGNGAGNFSPTGGAAIPGASGWHGFKTVIGSGDVDGDGKPDVMAVGTDGSLRVYYGNGDGYFSNPAGGEILAESGWDKFQSVFAAGDVNHDGYRDLWAVQADGKLLLFEGNAANRYAVESRELVSSGW